MLWGGEKRVHAATGMAPVAGRPFVSVTQTHRSPPGLVFLMLLKPTLQAREQVGFCAWTTGTIIQVRVQRARDPSATGKFAGRTQALLQAWQQHGMFDAGQALVRMRMLPCVVPARVGLTTPGNLLRSWLAGMTAPRTVCLACPLAVSPGPSRAPARPASVLAQSLPNRHDAGLWFPLAACDRATV